MLTITWHTVYKHGTNFSKELHLIITLCYARLSVSGPMLLYYASTSLYFSLFSEHARLVKICKLYNSCKCLKDLHTTLENAHGSWKIHHSLYYRIATYAEQDARTEMLTTRKPWFCRLQIADPWQVCRDSMSSLTGICRWGSDAAAKKTRIAKCNNGEVNSIAVECIPCSSCVPGNLSPTRQRSLAA